MGRNNDDINKAYKQGYKFTYKQLKSWGLKFHKLHMGKPSFDFLVDDKSIGFKKNNERIETKNAPTISIFNCRSILCLSLWSIFFYRALDF